MNVVNRCTKIMAAALVAMCARAVSAGTVAGTAETVPPRLLGTWRITRTLPTGSIACWNNDQARLLLNTTLTYKEHAIRWHGGEVPLQGVVIRELTPGEFRQENSGSGGHVVDLGQLGIRAASVTEVDLQHEDQDITGATTEVPGDVVLLAAPNRIIVSVCHVFFEATRVTPRPPARR